MEICKECGGIAEWNSYYGGITCTQCGHVEKPMCPMFRRCECKTAMCRCALPDESCYWYRWFKQRINEVEGK